MRLDFNVCVSIDNIYGVSVWKSDVRGVGLDIDYTGNITMSVLYSVSWVNHGLLPHGVTISLSLSSQF